MLKEISTLLKLFSTQVFIIDECNVDLRTGIVPDVCTQTVSKIQFTSRIDNVKQLLSCFECQTLLSEYMRCGISL